MLDYLLERLREASTWRGFTMLLTSVGIALNPEEIAAIVTAGVAVAGLIGVLTSDKDVTM